MGSQLSLSYQKRHPGFLLVRASALTELPKTSSWLPSSSASPAPGHHPSPILVKVAVNITILASSQCKPPQSSNTNKKTR